MAMLATLCALLLLLAAAGWVMLTTLVLGATQTMVAQSSSATTTSSSPHQTEPRFPEGEPSPFLIIIDGGSTGSRLHIFEFTDRRDDDEALQDGHLYDPKPDVDRQIDDDRPEAAAEEEERPLRCIRVGSIRADPALSSFGRLSQPQPIHSQDPQLVPPLNATALAEHLLPAFRFAAEKIPPRYHATTRVLLQATAGMRLLPEEEQEAIYDALYQGLKEAEDFVFGPALRRSDLATLSGELEGFYGAVAANYLHGTINAQLELIRSAAVPEADTYGESPSSSSSNNNPLVDSRSYHHRHGPIGALDMGGSSTQIVFLPGPPHANQDDLARQSCPPRRPDRGTSADGVVAESDPVLSTCHVASQAELPSRLNGEDFFATSYLSYGVDQFRRRLWSLWVQEHEEQRAASAPSPADDTDDGHQYDDLTCAAKVIDNPCAFKGYVLEWEGYQLVGTGDAHACTEQVRRLIPHPEHVDQASHLLGSHVGGVPHPPVRGKFFAMSLYFFTLDSLRELSRPKKEAHEALNGAWPTPSIQELHDALEGLCSRSWPGDLELIQHEAHAFTRAEVLPHRCLESVYMVTLLRDGFGFEPHSRDITFTFLVDGSEVEWSLGMALVLRAEEMQGRDEMSVAALEKEHHQEHIHRQEAEWLKQRAEVEDESSAAAKNFQRGRRPASSDDEGEGINVTWEDGQKFRNMSYWESFSRYLLESVVS